MDDTGSHDDSGPVREHLEPADAFALLGDETRLDIVRTLAEWSIGAPPTFAELRRAVGVADDGRFNYHLGRLRGHFVVKDGEHYRTTYAGEKVYEALVTGTFTYSTPAWEQETDHGCPLCGAATVAHYADGHLSMTCPSHGEIVRLTLPPRAAAGRDLDGLLQLADLEARRMHRHIADGVCPRCWATLPDPEYTDSTPEDWEADGDASEPESTAGRPVLLRIDCSNCGTHLGSSPRMALSLTADAVAFFADHGVDAYERNMLDLPTLFDDGSTDFRRDDDGDVVGATVSVRLADERLTAELDERGRVTHTERAPAE